MTKKEEKLLIEIESVREWIVESKEDFIGETRTNALFIIERILLEKHELMLYL